MLGVKVNKRVATAAVLALALLLALGAYAVFQEILQAVINVQTGNFDVNFLQDSASAQDNEPANLDIAQCTASVATTGDQMSVNLQNAYPGYVCDVSAQVRNDGSIHAIFQTHSVSGPPQIVIQNVQADLGPDNILSLGETGSVSFKVIVGSVAEGQNYQVTLSLTFKQALP